jgi:hypothetical protein
MDYRKYVKQPRAVRPMQNNAKKNRCDRGTTGNGGAKKVSENNFRARIVIPQLVGDFARITSHREAASASVRQL